MLTRILKWVGDFWVAEMLDELEQIADRARLKANFSKFKGSTALGYSRQLKLDDSLQSRSALLMAMAQYDKHLCNQATRETELAYSEVLGPWLFVMKWRAPIYSSPLSRASLIKLIESSVTCMEGYRFALQTRTAWLAFLEQLISEWSSRPLEMPLVSGGARTVLRYRGTTFVSTESVASDMSEFARRASLYASDLKSLMENMHPHVQQHRPDNTRAALVAAEVTLNGLYAHELRQISSRFEDLYLAASGFWKLEASGKILPDEQESICLARLRLSESMAFACRQMGRIYQVQLEQGEQAKQQFQLALSLL